MPVDRLVPCVAKRGALKQGDEKNRDVESQSEEQQRIEGLAKPGGAEGEDAFIQQNHRELRQKNAQNEIRSLIKELLLRLQQNDSCLIDEIEHVDLQKPLEPLWRSGKDMPSKTIACFFAVVSYKLHGHGQVDED